MSWDVFVQRLPAEAKRVAEVPDDYRPDPLGTRAELIAKIRAVYPETAFGETGFGTLDRDDFNIEISMGDEEPVSGLTLHVRGSAAAVYAVKRIIDALGARGLDSWTGEIFDPVVGVQSLHRWRAYVDEI